MCADLLDLVVTDLVVGDSVTNHLLPSDESIGVRFKVALLRGLSAPLPTSVSYRVVLAADTQGASMQEVTQATCDPSRDTTVQGGAAVSS